MALLIYSLIFFLKAYKILLKSDNEGELCCRYMCFSILINIINIDICYSAKYRTILLQNRVDERVRRKRKSDFIKPTSWS